MSFSGTGESEAPETEAGFFGRKGAKEGFQQLVASPADLACVFLFKLDQLENMKPQPSPISTSTFGGSKG